MEQRRENPRESGNSAGVVMGGINMTCYPIGLIPLTEAQAPAEAEGEDAEIRAVEAYRERIRTSLADILGDIAIKAVTANAEEIERLAEAACGIVTTLHLAGLLGRG